MKSYDLAQEELLEGLTITNNEELIDALEMVESYIMKQQYESIIIKAKEFFYQENYEDATSQFNVAISLFPKDPQGYIGLAEIYITQKKYDEAINLLEGAKNLIYNEEIRRMFDKAIELKEEEKKMKETLEKIYDTLEVERSRQFLLPEIG